MANTELPFDARRAGVKVRHAHNPSKAGETTGEVQFRAGRDVATIRLSNGELTYIPVDQLEPVPQQESRIEAFASGRTGGPTELARRLLFEKISGELTDVIYSMESGNADFHPHQFRPVIKFIESAGRRLLIADEVGLGKTISAIYVWKELQARGDARRLLIICPAALREKWRYELLNRFSIEARITDADALAEDIQATRRDTLNAFVRIGSIEGLRARQLDGEAAALTSRQRLMRLLQENPASEIALFDLVIVDEAHAARNVGTANYQFVEALRDASASLIMLTATPLQTHSENLFNLLHLIDPDRFVSFYSFEQARRANVSIIEALNALLRIPADRERFQYHLGAALREPLLRHDKLLIDFAQSVDLDWSEAQRVRAARTLESRSLIADVMVRTRKREAFQNRVVRRPWTLKVTLSPEERALYQKLSERIREVARQQHPGTPGEFVLIGRQRQLASCIPAAIAAWQESGRLEELLWEDLGIEAIDQESAAVGINIDDLIGKHDFEAGDSKYKMFSNSLREHLQECPTEKIVVFAFFRDTLAYLRRRLEADGINCATIVGGMGSHTADGRQVDAKTAEIERFRAPDGPAVLLSSEVGSEGIDLQFARMVFNYDLPWNPMRVEQRIGRIDRMGQTSDVIIVGHFATEGTIDDRILTRLYNRVNVFRESIGDLDEIFGEEINSIVLDYFRGSISPEEAELRLEQNRLAQESNRQVTEELEKEASALAGHADFIFRSIRHSRDAGRYVRPDDLQRSITDFVHEHYPGSQIEYENGSTELFRINLSAKAKESLGAFTDEFRPARLTRLADPGATVLTTFDPKVSGRSRYRLELIDVSHPLVLWMKNENRNRSPVVIPAIAVELDPTHAQLTEGLYVFVTDFWRLTGVRKHITLQHGVVSATTGEFLSKTVAENLIESASKFGRSIDFRRFDSEHANLIGFMSGCEELLVQDFLREADAFEAENATRVTQARQLVEMRAERIIERLQQILEVQLAYEDERRRRIASVTEARLRGAIEDRDKQLARIERQGRTEHGRRPVVGGLIVVQGGSP